MKIDFWAGEATHGNTSETANQYIHMVKVYYCMLWSLDYQNSQILKHGILHIRMCLKKTAFTFHL